MESKKIKALLTAAACGSLTGAAEKLGYTQAGLTQMMNAVESELGVKLLQRSKNGVRLSEQGQELLVSMQNFLSAAEAMEQNAAQLRSDTRPILRIGTYSSISRQWLPGILSNFLSQFPDVETPLLAGNIEQMYSAVRNEELDCAFVSYQPSFMKGLSWIPLSVDELLAVVPQDYPGESFALHAFDDQDFLMPILGFDLDIDPIFDAPRERVRPRIRHTYMDDAALASMVAHGLGITILSRLIMQSLSYPVKTLPLDPPAYRHIGLIVSTRRQNEPLLRRFAESTKATLKAMEKQKEEVKK